MDRVERRALLEALAADATATTADRVRALEALDRLDGTDADRAEELREFYCDLDKLPEQAINEGLDATLVVDAVQAVLTGEERNGLRPEDFSLTAGVLEGELARRVAAETARARAEFDQQVRELEASFAARASQTAQNRDDDAGRRDDPGDGSNPPRSAQKAAGTASNVTALRVPDGIDVDAGWSRSRRRPR